MATLLPAAPWSPDDFDPDVTPGTEQYDATPRLNARIVVDSGQDVIPDDPIGTPRGPSTNVVAFTMPGPDPFSNGGPFSGGGTPPYYKLPLRTELGIGYVQVQDPVQTGARQYRPESYPWDEDVIIGGPNG